MGVRSKVKLKRLTIAQQEFGLREICPESECDTHHNKLQWRGLLSPTPLSQEYIIEVVYKVGLSPKIYVKEPQLIIPAGKKLPHVYCQKEKRLCLYYPRGKSEWNESMSLARTILPWASEWLFYYEIWLSTGEWLGGGIHDTPDKKRAE